MRFVVGLFALCGCRQLLGFEEPVGAIGAIDAAVDLDVSISEASSSVCFGSTAGLVKVCFDPPPSGARVLATGTLDTSAGTTCSVVTPQAYCVVAADQLTIAAGSTVVGTGTRPLVLVARTIVIDGALDVASHRGGTVGSAANSTSCNVGTLAGVSGGGAGATFVSGGGNGGSGVSGLGGVAGAPVVVTELRGGCRAQNGGGTGPGTRGDSGGAVYLIASERITIAGRINASGAAGTGGISNSSGAGGGGSGGMIGFDAPTITNSGLVVANGGGGGEGAGNAAAGNAGDEATSTAQALGGSGGTASGGDGGAGAGIVAGAQAGSNGSAGGGGGGGGGAGLIRVFGGATLGGAVSPPAS